MQVVPGATARPCRRAGGSWAVGSAARGDAHPRAHAGTPLPRWWVRGCPTGSVQVGRHGTEGDKVLENSPAPFLPCEQGSERLFTNVTVLHKPKLPTDGSKWAR